MVLESWHGFASLPELSHILPPSPLWPRGGGGAARAEDRSPGSGSGLWDAAALLAAAGCAAGSARAERSPAELTSGTDVARKEPARGTVLGS